MLTTLQRLREGQLFIIIIKTLCYFYNTQRYQAKLNNLTPFEFRNQAI
ncbi:IS3 family transposase [Streptococcus hyointestinalis]